MYGILLVFAVVSFTNAQAPDQNFATVMEAAGKECNKETGFNGDYSGGLEDMPQEAKCYIACLAQKTGELSKDGLNLAKVKENMNKIVMNTPGAENALKFMEECMKEVAVIPDNLCETAYQYMLCEHKKMSNSS